MSNSKSLFTVTDLNLKLNLSQKQDIENIFKYLDNLSLQINEIYEKLYILSLNAPSNNGKDGKDGKDGIDGKDGRDGIDGQTNTDIVNSIPSLKYLDDNIEKVKSLVGKLEIIEQGLTEVE